MDRLRQTQYNASTLTTKEGTGRSRAGTIWQGDDELRESACCLCKYDSWIGSDRHSTMPARLQQRRGQAALGQVRYGKVMMSSERVHVAFVSMTVG